MSFDPDDYEPHGIICARCGVPLTEINAVEEDVTPDGDDVPTVLMVCAACCGGEI